MKTIWKYTLDLADSVTLEMPKGASLLDVQAQAGVPCLWAMVDPAQEKESRTFRIFGTGHPIDDALDLTFVGTFQIHGGSLVFHLFEVEEWPQTV